MVHFSLKIFLKKKTKELSELLVLLAIEKKRRVNSQKRREEDGLISSMGFTLNYNIKDKHTGATTSPCSQV